MKRTMKMESSDQKTLPNTGDKSSANLFVGYGLLSVAVAFGLVGRRRQDD